MLRVYLLPPLLLSLSVSFATALLGLPLSGLHKLTIAIGFLPDWAIENALAINQALGGPVSIIGDYINVSPADASFAQIGYHLPDILALGSGGENSKPVYAPAILYSEGLDTWTEEMTMALAKAVAGVNQKGIVVWLRLLFEMRVVH